MTQKTKNILFIVGFVLTLIIVYQLAIVKTLNLSKELKALEKQMATENNINTHLQVLQTKEAYLDSLLQHNNVRSSSTQGSLLDHLNTKAISNNFEIVNFEAPHYAIADGVGTNTYQFTLEGDFNALLSLLHSLEQDLTLGAISSALFEKKRNYRLRKDFLECSVILQTVE